MKKFFTGLLESFGRYLNQLPEEEVKRFTQKYVQNPITKGRSKKHHDSKVKTPSDRNDSFKGSGYNGKGGVNTDTRTFNRPRKDIPRGRDH